MARRTHFAVERLSSDGQVIVMSGYIDKWTYPKIQQELAAKTGEKASHSAIGRYHSKWKVQMERTTRLREQRDALLAAHKANNVTAEQVVSAFVDAGLEENHEALARADPIKLSRDQIDRLKLGIKRDEIQLRREEMEFNKRKAERAEAKEAAMKQAAGKAKERVALNPQEGAKLIDELYGLAQA